MTTFNAEVDAILAHKGRSKGYDGGKGQLWQLCRELPHPLGEIIYKVVRYARQGNPEDLVKIAGWARLIWEDMEANKMRGGTSVAYEPRSANRDSAVEDTARTADQGLVARIADSRAGDAGSPAGGTRHRKDTTILYRASIEDTLAKDRIGAGDRRSRAVDKQSRPRPRKGKKRT